MTYDDDYENDPSEKREGCKRKQKRKDSVVKLSTSVIG